MECWAATICTLTFGTTRTAGSSALRHGLTLLLRKLPVTHFYCRLSVPQGYWMRTEGIGHLKISKDICKVAVLSTAVHISERAGDFCGGRTERQHSVRPVQFVFRFGTVLKESL